MICFGDTLSFVNADPMIHSALQHIHGVVLKVVSVAYPIYPHETPMMQLMMECYNIIGGPNDGDDPRNINIPKYEGSGDIGHPRYHQTKFTIH